MTGEGSGSEPSRAVALYFDATRGRSAREPRLSPVEVVWRRGVRVGLRVVLGSAAIVLWIRYVADGEVVAILLALVMWAAYVGGAVGMLNPFVPRARVDAEGIAMRLPAGRSRFVPWEAVADVAVWGRDSKVRALVLEESDLSVWALPFSESEDPDETDLVQFVQLHRAATVGAAPRRPPGAGGAATGDRVRVVGMTDADFSWTGALSVAFPVYLVVYIIAGLLGPTIAIVAASSVTVAIIWGLGAFLGLANVEADSRGITMRARWRKQFLPWAEIVAIDVDDQEHWVYEEPHSPIVVTRRDGSKIGLPWKIALLPPAFGELIVQRLLTKRPPQSAL